MFHTDGIVVAGGGRLVGCVESTVATPSSKPASTAKRPKVKKGENKAAAATAAAETAAANAEEALRIKQLQEEIEALRSERDEAKRLATQVLEKVQKLPGGN